MLLDKKIKDEVIRIAEEMNLRQSDVLREAINIGLPLLRGLITAKSRMIESLLKLGKG